MVRNTFPEIHASEMNDGKLRALHTAFVQPEEPHSRTIVLGGDEETVGALLRASMLTLMELKLAKEKREGELRLCMGVIVRLQHNLDEKSRDRDHLMKVLKGKQQKAQASLAPVK